jgi:putative ABC transport system permease protein
MLKELFTNPPIVVNLPRFWPFLTRPTWQRRVSPHKFLGDRRNNSDGHTVAGRGYDARTLKAAVRSIARAPGFAMLVIATMALGIGLSATMYGVLRAVFWRPLPFPEPDRLVTVWNADAVHGGRQRVSPQDFVDWSAESTSFESIGALATVGVPATLNVLTDGVAERVQAVYTSSGFFRVLGVRPIAGHALGPDDDRQKGRRRAVISFAFWRDRFGSDGNIVGRTIEIDTFRGGNFTIAGVMPAAFDYPAGTKLWLSLGDWGGGALPARDAAQRCCPWFEVFARLKPEATVERAASELTHLARGIAERHPSAPRAAAIGVVPLRESMVGSQRLLLGALAGAVGCVLLIGLANVVNLLLSRGVGRRREIATRLALGATRVHIARQLILEALAHCSGGAIGGLLLAVWTQRALSKLLAGRVPLIETAVVDLFVVGFAIALAAVAAMVCGLTPLVAVRPSDWRVREDTERRESRRLRRVLVTVQVALAVSLVAGAGLLLESLLRLQKVDVGFRTDDVVTVSLDVTTAPLRVRGSAARFLEELLPRIEALPGVRAVGATTAALFETGLAAQAITREDRSPLPAAESPQVLQSAITPGYLAAVGMAVLRGRGCRETDTAEAVLVALINETTASRYWPGENPIGKRFAMGSRERFGFFRAPPAPGAIEYREIVGVVTDIRSAGFAADVQPEVFYCYKQYPLYEPRLFVRAAGQAAALAPALRREIANVNSRAVVVSTMTLDEIAGRSLADPRLRVMLVAAFSILALALGMLGIYGVLSYTVRQRSREIGIRMALGADRQRVWRLVVTEAIRVTALGLLFGLAGAVAIGRAIETMLFGVGFVDITALAATAMLVLACSIAASCAPAWRATRVDPADVLRSE